MLRNSGDGYVFDGEQKELDLVPGLRILRALSSMTLRPRSGKTWSTSPCLHGIFLGNDLAKQMPQAGNIPLPIAKIIELSPHSLRLLGPEHGKERFVG